MLGGRKGWWGTGGSGGGTGQEDKKLSSDNRVLRGEMGGGVSEWRGRVQVDPALI